MITRKMFLITSVLVALAGLSASALVGWHMHSSQPVRASAAWVHHFSNPAEMVRGSDAIALVRAGETRLSRLAESDPDRRGATSDTLPFEVTEFSVVRGFKGAAEGDVLAVERAGGTTERGEAVYLDHDGGQFQAGGTYLLFLRRQEDGPYYYQVNDDARFVLEGDRLRAAVDPSGPVARYLHGRTLDDAARAVRNATGTE